VSFNLKTVKGKMMTAKTSISSNIAEQRYAPSPVTQNLNIYDVVRPNLCAKIIISLTTGLFFSLLLSTVDTFFIVRSIASQAVENIQLLCFLFSELQQ
jgi:hypothetical protein